MRTKTRIERVSNEFSQELNRMWLATGRQITKVNITRQIAHNMKNQKQKKSPKYKINYWPLANRVDEVY